jgi:general secretion pathway protein D
MPHTDTPSMPQWDDALALPPSFEEYLMQKEAIEEGND